MYAKSPSTKHRDLKRKQDRRNKRIRLNAEAVIINHTIDLTEEVEVPR